jgi:hypothetical protein
MGRPTSIAFFVLCALLQATASPRTQSQAAPQTVHDRFLLLPSAARLEEITRAIASPGVSEPLLALQKRADELLKETPRSVMDKGITPPSGDKHDYMSQAPYWWPDPAKPDGKPYIRRDGVRNPEINRIPDHDNLGHLASAVSTLGLVHHFRPGRAYAEHAARLARVWFLDPATRMNPHLKFGQGIPGINEGRGIGIIETRGLPDLLDGIILISESGAWTKADEAGLQAWMRDYLAWLTTSTYGLDESKNGNNHETWYDVQVAALALYTGQRDLARKTLSGAKARIDRHFEPDGRQPRELERTRSFDYSEFNLVAFFNLAALGERAGVDLWHYRSADGRSLRSGLDFLVPYAAGGKKWEFDQITPFRGSTIANILLRGGLAWRNPDYVALANTLGGASDRTRLLYGP